MNNHSDIIIIGAGPGGYETAIAAARRGLAVTLFERDNLGGTCLNRGCIPTKALCRGAEVIETIKEASVYGVEVDGFSADYAKSHVRMIEVVETLREGIRSSLAGVNVIHAEARLTPAGRVEADGETYDADKIIIATGSRPATLPIPGAELAMSSDELLRLTAVPSSLIIIGGGVIGMEFAAIMNAYGVDVTVIEYCKEILPPFDHDIAKRLRTSLSRKGIKFILSAAVTSIARDDDRLKVIYKGKKGECEIAGESVLMATGRRSVMPEGLDAAGVAYTPKGITVDDRMRTTAPHIYAIGDVNGRCMLAHAATAQGRVALGDEIDLNVIPSAVFTSPEVAMVGMTQEQAAERYGERLRVRSVQYGASGKAVAVGHTFGVVKMLTLDDECHTIVGCSILGAHASDLIQEVATVMAARLGADAIADTVHAHPTLGELVMMAAEQ